MKSIQHWATEKPKETSAVVAAEDEDEHRRCRSESFRKHVAVGSKIKFIVRIIYEVSSYWQLLPDICRTVPFMDRRYSSLGHVHAAQSDARYYVLESIHHRDASHLC